MLRDIPSPLRFLHLPSNLKDEEEILNNRERHSLREWQAAILTREEKEIFLAMEEFVKEQKEIL